ncbi:MAG: carbohydrate kinase, partial [Phaeodactylibacter sp.]|nr:carbohydrate kinase [Phaeodactylibacter sp.]
VHLDVNGRVLSPLYNYLKPFPEDLLEQFYRDHGPAPLLARQTASPQLGMLNSGMQLYWLKYRRPEIFAKIRWSLHFPQYLSYLLTGVPLSEFTSIGCHTGLWDFYKNDYHQWVYAGGIDRILPPIVGTYTSINTRIGEQKLKVGVGIHDSSGALIPYLRADRKPFLLISTGTWSIALNPFSKALLTDAELAQDCLNFMRVSGMPTKAARLFLGNEYSRQLKLLQAHFGVAKDAQKAMLFNEPLYQTLRERGVPHFHFESIELPREQPDQNQLEGFRDFEEAYHQLLLELVDMQVAAAKRAIGHTAINKLYVDGGFANNDLFVKMLSLNFPNLKIRTTQSPLGSALGAAIVIAEEEIGKKFLKKHYALRKVGGLPEADLNA